MDHRSHFKNYSSKVATEPRCKVTNHQNLHGTVPVLEMKGSRSTRMVGHPAGRELKEVSVYKTLTAEGRNISGRGESNCKGPEVK